MLRPLCLMALDTAIKNACLLPGGSANDYVAFHRKARIRLQELQSQVDDLERLVTEPDGGECTAAEALNKYLWVKSP